MSFLNFLALIIMRAFDFAENVLSFIGKIFGWIITALGLMYFFKLPLLQQTNAINLLTLYLDSNSLLTKVYLALILLLVLLIILMFQVNKFQQNNNIPPRKAFKQDMEKLFKIQNNSKSKSQKGKHGGKK